MRTRIRTAGFSLPELMMSLLFGLMLLAAFFTVLQRCRAAFAASESLAALHDSARQGFSILVPDLEHAGFYGYANAATLRFVRSGTVIADEPALNQPDAEHPAEPVPGLPSGSHDCGVNFAVDLAMPVQGTNNTYDPGAMPDCAPTAVAGGARADADTLTVRHASRDATKPLAGRLQLYSRRLASHQSIDLFADGHAPGAINEDAQVRDVEVRRYYVANNSVERRGWPALRVKALTESRGAAQFRDEEVLQGVEDLQVEFGVRDPADADGRISFLPADFTGLRGMQVLAVRLWLRIRADRTEAGFVDARPMYYAGVEFVPSPAEARQRRLLVERTVALRNMREP